MGKKHARKSSDIRLRLTKQEREAIELKSGGDVVSFAKSVVMRACTQKFKKDQASSPSNSATAASRTSEKAPAPIVGQLLAMYGLDKANKTWLKYIRVMGRKSGDFTQAELSLLKELESQSDRASAIIVCAMLDERLTEVIKKRFKYNDDLSGSLFGAVGPLTFNPKVRLAYALGIYGKNAERVLELMVTVRNKFAHAVTLSDKSVSFNTQSIARLCEEIWQLTYGSRETMPSPRFGFLFPCLMIFFCLADLQPDGSCRKLNY